MRQLEKISKLTNTAATKLQMLVRMKYADDNGYVSCVTCGAVNHYKEMHGGHFIPRTFHIHMLLEDNIHPQCVRCNAFRGESAKVPYTLFMIDTYGREFVEELENTKHRPIKRDRVELEDFIKATKERIKQQEIRLGVRKEA